MSWKTGGDNPARFPALAANIALEFIARQKQRAESLLSEGVFDDVEISDWKGRTKDILKKAFGEEAAKEYIGVLGNWQTRAYDEDSGPDPQYELDVRNGLRRSILKLEHCLEMLQLKLPPASQESYSLKPIPAIMLLLDRFHVVSLHLKQRQRGRSTLEITDEYDVQDLLGSLLTIFFNDIRPEEWTPSHAGKSARVDFFLKPEGIVVETKKTSESLGAKQVGDELILDIERYRNVPGCKKLICFVYDPDVHISNPVGLQSDLSREEEGFSVEVIIRPRHATFS